MWVIGTVRRSIQIAMQWQPMPAMRAAALGHLGRGVVRAAGAEERRARQPWPAARSAAAPWLRARASRCAQLRASRRACFISRLAITMRDAGRRQLAVARQQRCGRLVGLADHAAAGGRPARCRACAELVLEIGALLLDDDDFLAGPRRSAARPRARAARSCRPCRARMPSAPARASSMPRSSSAWRVSR